MSARVGITASKDYASGRVYLPSDYVNAVRGAGGVPWIVPPLAPAEAVDLVASDYLDLMDGLLLSGGVDVAPHHFGEGPQPGLGEVSPERDEMELALTRAALQRDLPILAICRGMQVLNVAAGGDIHQDIGEHIEGALQHRQQAPRWHAAHGISVEENTLLHEILEPGEEGQVRVNTLHHQAVRQIAPGFSVSARAADGVVEAMESPGHTFAVAVQWHPEMMYARSRAMRRIFSAFISAARGRKGVESC